MRSTERIGSIDMAKRPVKKGDKNLALQIYAENGRPLTQMEIARLTNSLTLEHVQLMSRNKEYESMESEGVTGKCSLHHGYNIGRGVCIAKKFLKYGITFNGCASCTSEEVISQLNYIFKHAFHGKYRAEWRKKKERRKKKS